MVIIDRNRHLRKPQRITRRQADHIAPSDDQGGVMAMGRAWNRIGIEVFCFFFSKKKALD
jgi:hypothetical protein